jgi:hypothetical protein
MKDTENTSLRYEIPEELQKKTSAYPVVATNIVPVDLKKVPDVASGGKRNRRYGLVMSISIIPSLEKEEDPIMIGPILPTMFFDADSIKDLGERAKAEIDGMVVAAEQSIDEEGNVIKDTGADKKVYQS